LFAFVAVSSFRKVMSIAAFTNPIFMDYSLLLLLSIICVVIGHVVISLLRKLSQVLIVLI